MTNALADRKQISFEQAEGAEPLPAQLRAGELSSELRARLWEVLWNSIVRSWSINSGSMRLFAPWDVIAYKKHVYRDHLAADEFRNDLHIIKADVKQLVFFGDYVRVFGFIQWILRLPECPTGFSQEIEVALETSRAAYRIFDGDTIFPIGSVAETAALQRAFVDLTGSEFQGARSHLRNAGSKLTEGDYPGSIRESIHAVEAVARSLEPSANTLPPALAKLESSVRIHGALRAGFNSLYGFTSDERGIGHALLELPAAQVDEVDALYMLGSCAAFVSYLINKARGAGLLGQLQN